VQTEMFITSKKKACFVHVPGDESQKQQENALQ